MNDPSNVGHVLVVEDDPFNGPFTTELLKASGFNTDLAGSASKPLNSWRLAMIRDLT